MHQIPILLSNSIVFTGLTLSQTGLTTGRLAKDSAARGAEDNGLGVAEDGADVQAAGALDVHEVRVGRLYESLELVGALLVLDGGVKKIDGQLYRNA